MDLVGFIRISPALLLSLLFLHGTLYGIMGPRALPGGDVYALLTFALSAYFGGALMRCLKLPPLIGMLTVGILFRNFHILFSSISEGTAATIRSLSLVIILLRAGLGLDPVQLRSLRWVAIRLSLVPCLTETVSNALLSHLLLGLPWLWSLMLGFIVCAVSAAILVPGALSLSAKGMGTASGVPTLLLAAVSLDNIVALTGFMVLFSTITTHGTSTGFTLMQRLLEPCIGLLIGTLFGVLLWYIPDQKDQSSSVVSFQVMLLCLGGVALTFLGQRIGFPGVGALGCVSLAFVASLRWRKEPTHFTTVTWTTGIMWQVLEPFLFGLVGAEVTFDSLHSNFGLDALVLLGGLLFRGLTTWFALLGSKLNAREKTFVSLSWISKATVQAAVGSEALDYCRNEQEVPEFAEMANKVLTLSVVSILLTAPLGAAIMDLLGPRLLSRDEAQDHHPFSNNYGACHPQEDIEKKGTS